jgi:hypothetical protein
VEPDGPNRSGLINKKREQGGLLAKSTFRVEQRFFFRSLFEIIMTKITMEAEFDAFLDCLCLTSKHMYRRRVTEFKFFCTEKLLDAKHVDSLLKFARMLRTDAENEYLHQNFVGYVLCCW